MPSWSPSPASPPPPAARAAGGGAPCDRWPARRRARGERRERRLAGELQPAETAHPRHARAGVRQRRLAVVDGVGEHPNEDRVARGVPFDDARKGHDLRGRDDLAGGPRQHDVSRVVSESRVHLHRPALHAPRQARAHVFRLDAKADVYHLTFNCAQEQAPCSVPDVRPFRGNRQRLNRYDETDFEDMRATLKGLGLWLADG